METCKNSTCLVGSKEISLLYAIAVSFPDDKNTDVISNANDTDDVK